MTKESEEKRSKYIRKSLKPIFIYKKPYEYILIWSLETKKSNWYQDINKAVDGVMNMSKNNNIYFGGGLAPKDYVDGLPNKNYTRCKQDKISSIVGFWLDVDVQAPHRGKKNLPASKDEAMGLIKNLPLEPTIIVDSGYGFQIWHLFNEPWEFEDEEERKEAQELLKLWNKTAYILADKRGWTIDMTFNLDRLMRLPGSYNNKGDPLPVKIIEINENKRYSPRDFEEVVIDPKEVDINFVSEVEDLKTAEFDLRLDSEANPSTDKLRELLNDDFAKDTWHHNRNDLNDNSASGYDLALANIAARKNWNPQEICDLLIACRRKNNCDLKLRKDYYQRTIQKAIQSKEEAEEEAEDEYEVYQMEDFHPREIARIVMNLEVENHNRVWEYLAEHDVMYCYDNEGFWRQKNIKYLENTIRNFLSVINPKWVKINKVREIKEEFKNLNLNPRNERRFDVGVNSNKKYINLKNGMLDWENMVLEEHDKNYYSQFQLPIKYDENYKCPIWKETLKEWLPDQKTRYFLQEYIGYCLIPDTSFHKAVILHGAGSNGKSTFLDVISRIFGKDNLSNIPMHRLAQRFQTAYIQDKLINVCPDIDPSYLKETGVIKTLIAGESLRGEYKFGESFDFTPVVRLIFSANEIPKARDKTSGWYRRFEIVDFPNTFSEDDPGFDPYLKEKLYKEIPGIFNWALKGLKRLKNQGYFTRSDSMEKAMADYMDENDSVRAFVREKTLIEPDKKIYGQELYEEYKSFCDVNGINNFVTRKKFTTSLKKEGIKVRHRDYYGQKCRFYIGIDLKKKFKMDQR